MAEPGQLLVDAIEEVERLREQLQYARRAMRALVIAGGGTLRVPFTAIHDATVHQDHDELVGHADQATLEWVWTLRRQVPGAQPT